MTTAIMDPTRPARQRRAGAPEKSGWRVPVALVPLSLIPVISGSLRLLEVAGWPQLMAISMGSGWVINALVAEWVIRRPTNRRAGGARARAALAGSR
jgi:hypothetical protein